MYTIDIKGYADKRLSLFGFNFIKKQPQFVRLGGFFILRVDKICFGVYNINIKRVRRQAALPIFFVFLEKTAEFREVRAVFSVCLISYCGKK